MQAATAVAFVGYFSQPWPLGGSQSIDTLAKFALVVYMGAIFFALVALGQGGDYGLYQKETVPAHAQRRTILWMIVLSVLGLALAGYIVNNPPPGSGWR